jgi:hypothetical protein
VTGRLLLAGSLLLALAPSLDVTARADGAPTRAATVRCSAGGGRTLSRSHQVRVFARSGTFYSCWLPTRRRTTLGRLGEPVLDGAAALSTHVRIDGDFVAFAEQAVGDPSYSLSTVISVNARTGRVAREAEPRETEDFDSFVDDVGVAADDALVYLQRDGSPCAGEHTTGEHGPDDALIAVEPGANRHTTKRHTLDCETSTEPEGSISKLLVAGQTVTWTHSGVAQTATLR